MHESRCPPSKPPARSHTVTAPGPGPNPPGPAPQEAALSALHACVAGMPAELLQPHALRLLQLWTDLLEAPATPPALLGVLLACLRAVLPAVPLQQLGALFGDLVDILLGWYLEPRLTQRDRWALCVLGGDSGCGSDPGQL